MANLIKQMVEEAKQDKATRNANIGFSKRQLIDNTWISCQVRNAYTGGMRTTQITDRTEWLVNGTRRSIKVVASLVEYHESISALDNAVAKVAKVETCGACQLGIGKHTHEVETTTADKNVKRLARLLKVHVQRNRITFEQLAQLIYDAHTHAIVPEGFVDWIQQEQNVNAGVQNVGPDYNGTMRNIERATTGEVIAASKKVGR